MILELLDRCGLQLGELKAIAVLGGNGSYTGIRIAATVANILHWLYLIPLVDVDESDFDEAVKKLLAGEEFEVTKTLRPSY
jgi:tRNA A37 threonylcarbamoyladenosine modification protein TsaB